MLPVHTYLELLYLLDEIAFCHYVVALYHFIKKYIAFDINTGKLFYRDLH